MPRPATGSLYRSHGRFFVRVTIDRPRSYALPASFDEPAAKERQALLAGIARDLKHLPDIAHKILGRAADAALVEVPPIRRYVDSILRGERAPAAIKGAETTIGDLAEQLLSGKLAERYPDRIKAKKKSLPADRSRLTNHVLPALTPAGMQIHDVRIVDFTLDDADGILEALPDHLEPESRRHVARLVSRLLSIAVYPLRLIPVSPLPRGWVPGAGPRKALAWLYPDEDRQLMGCTEVPCGWRMFWGFLAREGPRASEAWGLELPDIDLRHGILTLDENKTDDPRAWVLSPGVPSAIERWLPMRATSTSYVFVDGKGVPIADRDPGYLAGRFRRHLEIAGVTRPELFERSASRLPIRAHDLRGTFVTVSSASGRSEAWIMDRTGHGTSQMLNRYRRAIRTAQELELGELARLDEAIPELRASARAGAILSFGGNSGGIGGAVSAEAQNPAESGVSGPALGWPCQPCESIRAGRARLAPPRRDPWRRPRRGGRRAAPRRRGGRGRGSSRRRWRSRSRRRCRGQRER